MAYALEQVLTEWKDDCKLSEANLSKELYRAPMLHAKYLEIFVYFRAKYTGAEKKYNLMLWQKRKYWRGEMEKAELEKFGWSQWQGLKPTGQELNFLVDADRDLNDLKEVMESYKTANDTMEKIMRSVGGREYLLKTMVEHQKFQAGGY